MVSTVQSIPVPSDDVTSNARGCAACFCTPRMERVACLSPSIIAPFPSEICFFSVLPGCAHLLAVTRKLYRPPRWCGCCAGYTLPAVMQYDPGSVRKATCIRGTKTFCIRLLLERGPQQPLSHTHACIPGTPRPLTASARRTHPSSTRAQATRHRGAVADWNAATFPCRDSVAGRIYHKSKAHTQRLQLYVFSIQGAPSPRRRRRRRRRRRQRQSAEPRFSGLRFGTVLLLMKLYLFLFFC